MILNSPYISGSLTVTGNATIQGQLTVTGSLSGTASLASNSLLLEGTGSVGFATTASLLAVSSSQQQISASLLSLTASYNALSSSYTALSASYNVASSSFSTRITSDSSSLSSRTTQIENVYATTGSNSFTGVQNFSNTCTPNSFTAGASLYTAGGLRVTQDAYFSSSVYIKGNVTVYGTQSVAYISSSQLDIGTNIITVNTATPSIRYGGLSVFDSGSTGLTGSILWDSELNRWIYSNASGSGGGATYGGGMFISGPRNSQGIGCEQGTTACMLLVGQGGDHLTSSLIYHDSSVTCIQTAVIGTSTACFAGVVCSNGNVLVGGTGTTNYLPKFTGTSTIGNSLVQDDGSTIGLGIAPIAGAKAYVYGTLAIRSGYGLQWGTNGYNLIYGDQTTNELYFYTNNVQRLLIASTGAATFSSTLTTGGITGIAVSPSPNTLSNGSIDLLNGAGMFGYSNRNYITANMYYNTAWLYKATAAASLLNLTDGGMILYGAASGTAGTCITLTPLLSIAQTGAATFSNTINSTANGYTTRALYITGNTQPSQITWWDSDDVEQYAIAMLGNSGTGYWGVYSSTNSSAIDISTAVPKFSVKNTGTTRVSVASNTNAFNVYGESSLNDSYRYMIVSTGANAPDYQATDDGAVLNLGTRGGSPYKSLSAKGSAYFALSNGNVGIGTSSPTGRLTLQRSGNSAETDIDFLNEVGAGPKAKIRFGGTNEELSFWTGATATERMRITSGGLFNFLGTATTTNAQFVLVNDNSATTFQSSNSSSVAKDLIFTTTTERMRIASDGVITTFRGNEPRINFKNTNTLQSMRGGIYFYGADSGTPGSYISTLGGNDGTGAELYVVANSNGVKLTSGATSWVSNSDERLKTDLIPIDNAISKIENIRALTGRYKTDEVGISRSFLIAQDVLKVFPEAVSIGIDEEKTLGLRYTELIPVLIKAIQEQQCTICSQASRITLLESCLGIA